MPARSFSSAMSTFSLCDADSLRILADSFNLSGWPMHSTCNTLLARVMPVP